MNTETRSINIYKVYNLFSGNHNEISSKKKIFILKQALRMQKKNVVMNNFNLHHFLWKKLLYFKQYLFSNNLLNIMHFVNAILLLSRNIIMKNYQKSKIIINLLFATINIAEKLKFCEIIHEKKIRSIIYL